MAKKAKPFSPEMIQLQSRQNLSDMARIIDGLYQRANTPETREAVLNMNNALKGIRNGATAAQAILEVEELLYKVLNEYNQNLDDNKVEGMDVATISIINQIVATRKKMSACTVDADEKRGLKAYLKANKGAGKKSDLKAAYKKKYERGMAEADSYVQSAKILGQLVNSYRVQTVVLSRQSELNSVAAQIKDLAAKYKAATDQTTRDLLNQQYRTLLNKQQSIQTELAEANMTAENISNVDELLKQLKTQATLREIESGVDVKEIEGLAEQVNDGINAIMKRNEKVNEAMDVARSAGNKLLGKVGAQAARGASLDDVILNEQSASLDGITAVSSSSSSSADSSNGIPSLEDIL